MPPSPEAHQDSPVPYDDYPFLFGDQELPVEYAERHAANLQFARNLVAPEVEENDLSDLDRRSVETIARVLTATDHRLGANTRGLGTMFNNDEDGPWVTQPTFYHNGDGTRTALLGTKEVMDYAIELDGDNSPYADRETYLKTLLAAAYDDLVFGKYGRGEDERQSAALARAHLLQAGFDPDSVEDIIIAIEASIFDEKKFTQSYDPDRGAGFIQSGSLDGDLRDLGGRRSPMKTFMLLIENMWKKDTAGKHGQRLRGEALKEAVSQHGWQADSIEDFFALIERYPHLKKEFGSEMANNENFILLVHEYIDPRLNEALLAAKQQSARLQRLLGTAIAKGDMTVSEAFHCAVSYAAVRPGYNRRGKPAALPPDLTPDEISQILLAPEPIGKEKPVNAAAFFKRYKVERNIGGVAVKG